MGDQHFESQKHSTIDARSSTDLVSHGHLGNADYYADVFKEWDGKHGKPGTEAKTKESAVNRSAAASKPQTGSDTAPKAAATSGSEVKATGDLSKTPIGQLLLLGRAALKARQETPGKPSAADKATSDKSVKDLIAWAKQSDDHLPGDTGKKTDQFIGPIKTDDGKLCFKPTEKNKQMQGMIVLIDPKEAAALAKHKDISKLPITVMPEKLGEGEKPIGTIKITEGEHTGDHPVYAENDHLPVEQALFRLLDPNSAELTFTLKNPAFVQKENDYPMFFGAKQSNGSSVFSGQYTCRSPVEEIELRNIQGVTVQSPIGMKEIAQGTFARTPVMDPKTGKQKIDEDTKQPLFSCVVKPFTREYTEGIGLLAKEVPPYPYERPVQTRKEQDYTNLVKAYKYVVPLWQLGIDIATGRAAIPPNALEVVKAGLNPIYKPGS